MFSSNHYLNGHIKIMAVIIPLIFFTIPLRAQQSPPSASGKIEGIIVDSISKTPVEYATIAVYVKDGSRIITGTTSDSKGKFSIDKIPQGNYRIVIDFIGYKKKIISPVKVDGRNTASLGTILLSTSVTTLGDVTVTAQRNIIENKIDKLVYNAENDITSQSGVATDVLKKVPQITVDVDGNVELQGNSNIRFLIDGKPSTVFGNNISDVLQTIPASRIQSIEVVTSPGAKYDAEGTGGIINIILKKTTIKGISGNTSLSAGSRLENGSMNLNFRTNHIGINAFLSGNTQMPSKTLSSMDRTTYDSLGHYEMLQDGNSQFRRYGYQGGLGFDWSVSSKDNLTASLNYNYFGNHSTSNTDQKIMTFDNLSNLLYDRKNVLKSTNDFYSRNFDWSVSYRHKFNKKGHELDFLYNSSYSKNYLYYEQTQNMASPDSILTGSKGTNPGTNRESDFSLDYSLPVGDFLNIEAGGKATLYELKSNTDVDTYIPEMEGFLANGSQSYTLKYDRNIYAGYITGAFTLFHWLDMKLGSRYELTQTKIVYTNNPNVEIPDYHTIAPSFIVSHTFKNNHTIKFSYSYRIQRPDYRDLNPFINLSDPHNITTGNPQLDPEISHSFELSYSKVFTKGGNINISAFYRRNVDDIQQYVTYYPTYRIGDSIYSDVTVTSRQNISKDYRSGLNIYGSFPLIKGLNLRTNLSASDHYVENTGTGKESFNSFEYRINLNLTYQLPWNLAIEFFGNFNSPRTNVQGKVPSFTSYNFAVRKQFLKKQASIALTAVNPFNEYIRQKTELSGDNFTLNSLRQMPFRSFGINLTYKFGKMQFKPEQDEHNDLMNPQGM
ncbi:MAG: outer membrane beta-barrel family protein [Bacteroidota bacterium]|nr:outer membrane beta-barrel family protein [Bacteroidota bacterium]